MVEDLKLEAHVDEAYDAEAARLQQIEGLIAEGLSVIEPQDNQLQVDIDSEAAYEKFLSCWTILARYHVEAEYVEKPSKSGLPHRHITVTLPFIVSEAERIAFQGGLGSDPKRELMGILRNMAGITPCSIFAEKVDKGA